MVEFSKKTMIPYRSLKHIIKRVKDTIKQQYNDSINSNSIDDLPPGVCQAEQRESIVR
jgi:Ethanolamine utilization protein EutJ (predicted chaperonin)